MRKILYLFLFLFAFLAILLSHRSNLLNHVHLFSLNSQSQNNKSQFQLSETCKIRLNNSNTAYSQFGQDLFLYNNFFKERANGYYIDLGSYHPMFLSNTFLFDQCLNWTGLCLDMNNFHEKEYEKRKCIFIQTCISNRSYVDYYKQDDSLANGNEGTSRTYCTSFDKVFGNHSVKKQIELLSIDIEGDELYALQTFDFIKYNVSYLLVETYHNKNRQNIFDFLQSKGFVHIVQIGPDDLFENRFNKYWFPNNHNQWKKDIENNVGNS